MAPASTARKSAPMGSDRPLAAASIGAMRTHAHRPGGSAPTRPPDRRSPQAAPATPEPRTADDVQRLQAQAGNRATVQALRDGAVVQRALSVDAAERIARRLHDAMEGWGTDEEAIYGALAGRTPTDWQAIQEAYRHLYDTDLEAELVDELTEGEMARVRSMLSSTRDAAALPEADQAGARRERARQIAQQLHEAMDVWGTEEDQIFNALEGRSREELTAITDEYRALTGRMLESDLRDELSGDDLRRAYRLLGVSTSGAFTNEIEQAMTEGYTTVVRGRFEWSIRNFELHAEAPVKFVPDAGVTPPYDTWNGQIDTAWNNFEVAEPGGRRIPITLSLRNDSGCSREVLVHKNKDPAKWWEDRANAGEWYEQMKPSTAPHEFGHYIGLPDEYQRTHGDITRITGSAPATGPENASGRTPAQIAADLRAAFTLEDATQRAPQVTTVLRSVGLIDAGGRPQQGDFAQSVKTAYDATYSPGLVRAMADDLPAGSKWTIQTVFSYASRTLMGDPGGLGGTAPHDHAVEPRHLQEFGNIVKRVWPAYEWQVRRR